MSGVGGGGRRNLFLRMRPTNRRWDAAGSGGERPTSGRGPIFKGWAGPCRRRSWAGRGPGRLAHEAREAMATLREVGRRERGKRGEGTS